MDNLWWKEIRNILKNSKYIQRVYTIAEKRPDKNDSNKHQQNTNHRNIVMELKMELLMWSGGIQMRTRYSFHLDEEKKLLW